MILYVDFIQDLGSGFIGWLLSKSDLWLVLCVCVSSIDFLW